MIDWVMLKTMAKEKFWLLVFFLFLLGGISFIALEKFYSPDIDNLLAFIAWELYDFWLVIILFIFIMLLTASFSFGKRGNIPQGDVEAGKIAIATEMRFLSACLFILLVCTAALVWWLADYLYGFSLWSNTFLVLNAAFYGLLIFFAGMSLLFTSLCVSKVRSLLAAAMVFAFFLLLRILALNCGAVSFMSYLTPFSLVDIDAILTGDSQALWKFLILYIGGIVLYFGAMAISVAGCNQTKQ